MIPLGVLAARQAATGGALSLAYIGATGSTADGIIYTLTGVPIGTPSPDRTVIIIATGRSANPSLQVSSLTIDGTPAALDVNAKNAVGGGNYEQVCIARLVKPTGTAADIVVAWSDIQARLTLFVYAFTGADVTPVDTAAAGAASGLISATVSAAAGGYIIAGGTGTDAHTWTGVTQDDRVRFELWSAAASAQTPTAGDVTVSLNTTFNHSIGVVAYAPA